MESSTTMASLGVVKARGVGASGDLTEVTHGGSSAAVGHPTGCAFVSGTEPLTTGSGGLMGPVSTGPGSAVYGVHSSRAAAPGGMPGEAAARAHRADPISMLARLKASLAANLGELSARGTVALNASAGAKAVAALGIGLAAVVVAAHMGDVLGVQGVVSVLPPWTAGQSILTQM